APHSKKHPFWVVTSAPPRNRSTPSRLITQPLEWLDLSLNKLSDLVVHQLANLDRQRDPTPRELMQHSVRGERAIGNKDWSLVGRVDLFSAVHLHVREPSVGHP